MKKCVQKPSNFIILNGGESFRVNMPVCNMLLSNGESIIERQQRVIKSAFASPKFFHVLGNHNKVALDHIGHDAKYVINDSEGGTLNSALLAINKFKLKNAFIIHGNVVFNEQPFIKVSHKNSTIFTCENNIKYRMGASNINGTLLRMMWGLSPMWSDICYVNKAMIQRMKDAIELDHYKNAYLFEIFNLYANEIKVLPLTSKVIDIKNNKNIEYANSIFEIK